MISFIVIGKNEAINLNRCFQSIITTIQQNRLEKQGYEIIYVDSNSSDNSIEIARGFKEIKIFKITGICNAAIGRNIGAKEATGDILVFIDGDMELNPKFFSKIFNSTRKLMHPCISGQLINYYYNSKGEFLFKQNSSKFKNNNPVPLTGGYFIIERKVFCSIGGFRNELKYGEDPDLGLRLAKQGIFLLRLPDIFGNHYTISYLDIKRMWKMLINKSNFYNVSLMMKKNFRNKYFWRLFFKQDKTLIALIVLIMIYITLRFNVIYLLVIYMILVIMKSIKNKKKLLEIVNLILYYPVRDLSSIMGLIFFNKKRIDFDKIEYEEIR